MAGDDTLRPESEPVLLVLNQMAGPMTWELVVDLARTLGPITLLTGHPDTLKKGSQGGVRLVPSVAYKRGSFLVRSWRWLRYSLHAQWWLFRQSRSTPILLFSNPPIALWFVRWNHWLRGTPYAVMVHDIFPDVLVRKSVARESNPIVRLWRLVNRWAYRSSEVVLTLGRHMANTLERSGAISSKSPEIVVIPPWADDQKITPQPKRNNWFAKTYNQVDKITCMYSGNMGLGHDLESMCHAARELQSDPGVRFMFVGAGPKWADVERFRQEHQLENTVVLGWQPEADIPYSLATADIGLVSLESELSGLAVPSKAYYFLAANVPLIAVCDSSNELAELIHDFGCGVVIPPGQPQAIVHAIAQVSKDRGVLERWRSGAQAAMQAHRRVISTERFARVLSEKLRIPRERMDGSKPGLVSRPSSA